MYQFSGILGFLRKYLLEVNLLCPVNMFRTFIYTLPKDRGVDLRLGCLNNPKKKCWVREIEQEMKSELSQNRLINNMQCTYLKFNKLSYFR